MNHLDKFQFSFFLFVFHGGNCIVLDCVYCRWSASGNGGKLEAVGYKEGYRVDVDVPESTWEKAPSFHDILIFNTGHWLAFFPLPLKCCRSFGANNIMVAYLFVLFCCF